ncbi:MAG: PilT/PilU family type 4a pilus ATPase [Phycisphaerae bacterium]|nr:PilT/PilU family type 4a pilus ATPase [Phycisphaerae bacterium]
MKDSRNSLPPAEISPKILGYFRAMEELDATDLHIKTDAITLLRVKTALRKLDEPPLDAQAVEKIIDSLLSDDQKESLTRNGNVDLAYEIPHGDRFRINIFRQRGTISLAARRVTRKIPSLAELNLPENVAPILDTDHGLILLAGPTSSGKSTTIAAMLEHINQHRHCHIVTIEDPIEYLYEDKKSLINQREIGIDVPNFTVALRSVLREDPDIILIGEMRDRETFQAALQASETGHLVFGTIHAGTAGQTVSRILDLFPHESRQLVLQSLAYNLRAIVCQKLLPCVKKGINRVPAIEILRTNPVVRDLLETGRDGELADVIRSHEADGMQNFTKSLLDLIENGMVDPKTAYAAAPNSEELKMRVKGISQSGGNIFAR